MGLSAALPVELARRVEGSGEAGVAQTVVHNGRAASVAGEPCEGHAHPSESGGRRDASSFRCYR